jgi:hypothetical protein
MRVVPSIPQAVPVPSLPALVWMGFELWRMRRVQAGLDRARARGDDEAVLRWLHRVDRALADLDRAQARMRPRRPPRRPR